MVEIQVPIAENSNQTAPVSVRLYMLPIEDWHDLPRKTLKNDLQVFERRTVSFMRNDREVFSGTVRELTGTIHTDSDWLRLQIDFSGELDEAFGVAMNKQGIRPKKYALDCIKKYIKDEISKVRSRTAQFRKEYQAKASGESCLMQNGAPQRPTPISQSPCEARLPPHLKKRQNLSRIFGVWL